MQYVGKSVNLQKRFYDHKCKSGQWIDNEIEKYGEENFDFIILEYCSVNTLEEREKYWIAYYDTFNNGYNKTRGGCGKLKYNYDEIISLWNKGYNCNDIMSVLHCSDGVVTTALRCNNISEDEVRKRVQQDKIRSMIAYDITTKTPLKIFHNYTDIEICLNHSIDRDALRHALHNPFQNKAYGYYWNYLSEVVNYIPELSNAEFLSYAKDYKQPLTEEAKMHLSNSRREVERPTREILKQEIRIKSFVALGKQYDVSDNAIRKWCIFYNLPSRKKDIKTYTDEEWEKL